MKVLRGGASLESPVTKIEAKALIRRPSGRGGWVSLNLEELVARWFEDPKDNHGIVLHATDEHDRQIVVTDHEEDDGALVSNSEWREGGVGKWAVCVCVCVGGWTGREASFSPADYEYFLTT
jgi:hypothetical protein